MDNHTKIFPVLRRHYQAKRLRVQKNTTPSDAIIAGAKQIMSKPFYMTWSSAIPEVALQEELTFSAFRLCILLVGVRGDFWNGRGQFLPDMQVEKEYSLCGFADLAFTVLLDAEIIQELKPYLEDPEAAKLQKQAERTAMLEEYQKIRDRIDGK